MRKIKGALLLVFIITSLLIISVVFLGLRSLRSTETAVKNEYNQRQLLLAEGTARGIEQYLDSLVHQMALLSALSSESLLRGASSKTILKAAYDDLAKEGINDMGVLDADGILRNGVKAPFLIGTDFSYRKYFKEAKSATSANEYAIEFIEFKGADLGEKGVAVAIPMIGTKPSNTFNGVLLVTLPLRHVTQTFIEPMHKSSQHTLLVDKRYSILWSADKSQFGRNILRESKKFPKFQRMLREMIGGEKGTNELVYLGFDQTNERFSADSISNTLFAYAPVSLGDQEWFVALWTAEEEVLKLTNSTFLYLATILGAAVSIILLAGAITSIWIVRSTDRLNKRQARSDALSRISDELNSTLDVDEIMARVVKSANEAMGCDTTGIGVIEQDYLVVKYSYGFMKNLSGTKLNFTEAGAGAGPAASGEPLVVNDAFSDARVDPDHARKFSIRSYLSVPVVINGKRVGALAFHYNRKPTTFTPEDIDFAYRVAASVSMSLDNAHLFQTEQSIADALQTALLVMPEKVRGVSFGHLYKSATDTQARVGGDFYDLFEIHDQLVGIVIGDVSGKGTTAASVTSMVKNTIKAFAQEFDSPAQVLGKTNEMCVQNIDSSMFVTAWFGILNGKSGSLIYSNAGHPPPLVKKKGGRVVAIKGEANFPLGVLSGTKFSEERSGLNEEEMMILLTDGVFEARKGKSFLGWERLAELIDGLESPLSTETLPSLIVDKIIGEAEYRLVDDVAIMAISLNAETMLPGAKGPINRIG